MNDFALTMDLKTPSFACSTKLSLDRSCTQPSGSRPDIAHAVQQLSQFSSNPSPAHSTAAKCVLRYIKGTRTLGIVYYHDDTPPEPIGYSDADWANNPDDRKSIGGQIFFVAGGAVTWSSRKQRTLPIYLPTYPRPPVQRAYPARVFIGTVIAFD